MFEQLQETNRGPGSGPEAVGVWGRHRHTCLWLFNAVVVATLVCLQWRVLKLEDTASSSQTQLQNLSSSLQQCLNDYSSLQNQTSRLSSSLQQCFNDYSSLQNQTSRFWRLNGSPNFHIFPVAPSVVVLDEMSRTFSVQPNRFYRIAAKIPVYCGPYPAPQVWPPGQESFYRCQLFVDSIEMDTVWSSQAAITAAAWYARSMVYLQTTTTFMSAGEHLVEFKCSAILGFSGATPFVVGTDSNGANSFFVEISEFFALPLT